MRALAASLCVLAAGAAFLVGSASNGSAQAKKDRPPQEEPEDYPQGANRDDTFYFCTACHSFKIVAAQGMSRQRWNDTLDFMVSRHNMPNVQGEDREKMLDYLATAFPERAAPGGWKSPFAPR